MSLWHTSKEQLRDAVVELLITQPRKCVTELKAHLQKMTQSYKQLVLELIEGKDMKVGIFFLCRRSTVRFGRTNIIDSSNRAYRWDINAVLHLRA